MSQVILKTKGEAEIKTLVSSALKSEENELRTGILKTKQKLASFEHRFKLSTAAFLKASSDSLSIGEMDAIEWSGEYETLRRLETALANLSAIEICS